MHANIFKQIIVILIKSGFQTFHFLPGKEDENKQAIVIWITSILFFTC